MLATYPAGKIWRKDTNNLAKTIGEVIDDPTTPRDVADSLDMVRNIGNFSAHPNKSTNTGEIVPVEPVEAEWCLDVIEMLFDLYFVRPSEIQKRRDSVNEKLEATGKPPKPPMMTSVVAFIADRRGRRRMFRRPCPYCG